MAMKAAQAVLEGEEPPGPRRQRLSLPESKPIASGVAEMIRPKKVTTIFSIGDKPRTVFSSQEEYEGYNLIRKNQEQRYESVSNALRQAGWSEESALTQQESTREAKIRPEVVPTEPLPQAGASAEEQDERKWYEAYLAHHNRTGETGFIKTKPGVVYRDGVAYSVHKRQDLIDIVDEEVTYTRLYRPKFVVSAEYDNNGNCIGRKIQRNNDGSQRVVGVHEERKTVTRRRHEWNAYKPDGKFWILSFDRDPKTGKYEKDAYFARLKTQRSQNRRARLGKAQNTLNMHKAPWVEEYYANAEGWRFIPDVEWFLKHPSGMFHGAERPYPEGITTGFEGINKSHNMRSVDFWNYNAILANRVRMMREMVLANAVDEERELRAFTFNCLDAGDKRDQCIMRRLTEANYDPSDLPWYDEDSDVPFNPAYDMDNLDELNLDEVNLSVIDESGQEAANDEAHSAVVEDHDQGPIIAKHSDYIPAKQEPVSYKDINRNDDVTVLEHRPDGTAKWVRRRRYNRHAVPGADIIRADLVRQKYQNEKYGYYRLAREEQIGTRLKHISNDGFAWTWPHRSDIEEAERDAEELSAPVDESYSVMTVRPDGQTVPSRYEDDEQFTRVRKAVSTMQPQLPEGIEGEPVITVGPTETEDGPSARMVFNLGDPRTEGVLDTLIKRVEMDIDSLLEIQDEFHMARYVARYWKRHGEMPTAPEPSVGAEMASEVWKSINKTYAESSTARPKTKVSRRKAEQMQVDSIRRMYDRDDPTDYAVWWLRNNHVIENNIARMDAAEREELTRRMEEIKKINRSKVPHEVALLRRIGMLAKERRIDEELRIEAMDRKLRALRVKAIANLPREREFYRRMVNRKVNGRKVTHRMSRLAYEARELKRKTFGKMKYDLRTTFHEGFWTSSYKPHERLEMYSTPPTVDSETESSVIPLPARVPPTVTEEQKQEESLVVMPETKEIMLDPITEARRKAFRDGLTKQGVTFSQKDEAIFRSRVGVRLAEHREHRKMIA